MDSKCFRVLIPLVPLALAILAGCSDGTDVSSLTPSATQAAVESGAPSAAAAGDEADLESELIAAMMGQVSVGSASSGPSAIPARPASCPATFTLENGVGGTCLASESGTVTFTFSGTVMRGSRSVQLGGTLVVTPTLTQPPSGSQWRLDLDATAVGPSGTADWAATGVVDLDDAGRATDYDLDMTRTITGQGVTRIATVSLTPSLIVVSVTGPLGNVVRFQFDRETGTGTVSINGTVVATVALDDGQCLVVDYVNPELQDGTICPSS